MALNLSASARGCLACMGAATCLLVNSDAIACGGFWDTACNIGKAVEKGVQDVGKGAEQTVQDVGKTAEKAVQDTGKTIEKAAHDTGHALEKAGQDVGHLLKELTNFSLACSLPGSKPAELQVGYRESCGAQFGTYSNDIDVCNQAGGVSLIAASAAGSVLTTATTAGATYALAKVAFEICQRACRSQTSLNQCVASVDASAKDKAEVARQLSQQNAAQQDRLAEFACVDEAYGAEKLLVMDSVLARCESEKNCNTASDEFKGRFTAEVNVKLAEIQSRRDQAKQSFRDGKRPIRDYGAVVQSRSLKSLVLTYQGGKDAICRAKVNMLELHAVVSRPAPKALTARFSRDRKRIMDQEVTVDPSNGSAKVAFNLSGKGFGKWRVDLMSSPTKRVGSYRFVYRAEPQ